MVQKGAYVLVFTLFTLGLTFIVGWWLEGGRALLALYLAIVFFLPPLLWVALDVSQRIVSHSFGAQLLAALSVQLIGLGLLYFILFRAVSPAAFLAKLAEWRVSMLLLLPFWLAFILTGLLFKRVPAVRTQN